ncbi:MAG: YbaN family protein [Endozoicomonas sp.]
MSSEPESAHSNRMKPVTDQRQPLRNPVLRLVCKGLAVLCIFLGVLGVFLPLLPTTPFLLLATWLSMRSSPRLNHWLLHHPRLGPPLQQYLAERSISPAICWRALLVLWSGMALAIWLAPLFPVKIMLAVIALCVSVWLLVLARRSLDSVKH